MGGAGRPKGQPRVIEYQVIRASLGLEPVLIVRSAEPPGEAPPSFPRCCGSGLR